MKKLLPVFLILLLACNGQAIAQLYQYTNAANGSPALVDPSITGTSLGYYQGVDYPTQSQPCGVGGGFQNADISTTTTFATTVTADTFSIRPLVGQTINVADFKASVRRSSTGGPNIMQAYSLDGGANWITKPTGPDVIATSSCGAMNPIVWNTTISATYPTTILFAIFVYGSTGTDGRLQVTDVIIDPPNCTPPTLSTTTTNASCTSNNDGSISLTASGASNTYTYAWTGPNGYTSTSQNPAHLYPGVYTVTVSTTTGCTATTTATVNATFVATATLTPAGPTSFCPGDSVSLTANTNVDIVSYVWKRDSVTIPGAAGYHYVADTDGHYTVLVTYSNGCYGTSDPITVILNRPDAAITPAGPTLLCYAGTVQLDANTGSGLSYVWKRNGLPQNTSTGPTYIATATGIYTVAVTNSDGCINTSDGIQVVVADIPSVTTASPKEFCWGSTARLDAYTGTPTKEGIRFQWQHNGIDVGGATDSSMFVISGGTYRVFIYIDSAQCSDSSLATTLIVHDLPNPIISQNGRILNVDSFVTYQWYLNNDPIQGATGPSIDAQAAGTYRVAVSDTNGCIGTSEPLVAFPLAVTTIAAGNVPVKIYPNPASSIVHIESAVKVNVAVKSLEGKLILQQDNTSSVNISQLPSGMYMMLITDANGTLLKVEKLVKADQ